MKVKYIVILLFSLHLQAQNIIPLEQQLNYTPSQNGKNYYYKDVNGVLNKFLGNWRYQVGTEVVDISIFKDENESYGRYHKDDIYVQFKYTKNGVILINTLNNSGYNHLIFDGHFKKSENINQIHILYIEPGQTEGNRQWLDIEYIESTTGPKLHWIATYEVLTSVVTPPKMPLDMTFIKQP